MLDDDRIIIKTYDVPRLERQKISPQNYLLSY